MIPEDSIDGKKEDKVDRNIVMVVAGALSIVLILIISLV